MTAAMRGQPEDGGSMLGAALVYVARGRPVFPCDAGAGPSRKRPLTERGYKDASTEPAVVTGYWRRWPTALIGTPTGRGFVVLDVDVRQDRDGFAMLARLGVDGIPSTPAVRTPSGGAHLYFAQTAPPIRCTAGARGRGIGPGLDWRGDGGYVILPAPGCGYDWIVDMAMPLAPVPAVLLPSATSLDTVGISARCDTLSAYGEAALRSAAKKILAAPCGEQEITLNGESFSIGRLAGAGGVPVELALDILLTAARAIPSHDRRRPWRPAEIETKVRASFAAGLARPRPAEARDVEW